MLDFGPAVLKKRTNLDLRFQASEATVFGDLRPNGIQTDNVVKRQVTESIGVQQGALVNRVLAINGELLSNYSRDLVYFIGEVRDDSYASQVGDVFEFTVLRPLF